MEPLILQSEECQLGAAAVYRLAHRGRWVEGGRESDAVVEKEKKVREKVREGVKRRNQEVTRERERLRGTKSE